MLPRASRARRLLAGAAVCAAVIAVAHVPVTTRQGVNFEVSTHRLPLYLKALQFVERSAQYQQIADEITRGAASDTERVLRVFDWTKRQIRETPEGWPIVDDHILHIIIRGHGVNDQQADVFATLSTYAGVPAFWTKVRPGPSRPGLLLSFARVDGRWRVFDVYNGFVFRTASGDLATLDEAAAHPELLPVGARAIAASGVPYSDLMTQVVMPSVPRPLRAEMQMPSARLWHELLTAAHLRSSDEL